MTALEKWQQEDDAIRNIYAELEEADIKHREVLAALGYGKEGESEHVMPWSDFSSRMKEIARLAQSCTGE